MVATIVASGIQLTSPRAKFIVVRIQITKAALIDLAGSLPFFIAKFAWRDMSSSNFASGESVAKKTKTEACGFVGRALSSGLILVMHPS